MTILYANDSDKILYPIEDSHDPDSEKYYYLNYYPRARQNTKAYIKGVDVVVGAIENGCLYECVSGGISAGTEPEMQTTENATFDDGTVSWKCKPLTTLLSSADAITASTWSGAGVTFGSGTEAIVSGKLTEVKVTAVPAGVSEFEITNTITITYGSGKTEKRQKTLVIQITQL